MKKIQHLWKWVEKITCSLFTRVFHKDLTDGRLVGILQFIKFGIVGMSNTVISYAIYVLALFVLQIASVSENIDYLIAQIIAFILSVLWSFYWNNKYVFDNTNTEERNIFEALLKTYISYAFTGLFLNSILSIVWVQILEISKLFAPIINLLISVPLNFVLNKFWAFK